MRRITPAEHRRVPWRNGGGTTSEILVEPALATGALADGARFRHRVSIADVERDGPFSRFGGYDRHIVLLSGAGMRLDCGDHGEIVLRPHEVRAFAGEWDVEGRLEGGPVRDFNLIVDRGQATSSLEIVDLAAPARLEVEPGATCIVHVVRGRVEGADEGDTLVLEAGATIAPRGDVKLIVCRVTPVA